MSSSNRLLFLCTALSPALMACIRALGDTAWRPLVIETSISKNCPLSKEDLTFDCLKADSLKNVIEAHRIHNFGELECAFVAGWSSSVLRAASVYLRAMGVPLVLMSDQPQRGSIRQYLGRVLLRHIIRRFDAAFVPGPAAKALLQSYGMEERRIHLGLYSADDAAFSAARGMRDNRGAWPTSFLFDGQYIRRKGFDVLLSEYELYRKNANKLWALHTVGKGPLSEAIPASVVNLGFRQPCDLPAIYSGAGCFVLPSREDHWPLVIHQAAMAGLPLIISKHCGNVMEFVTVGSNGVIIDPCRHGALSGAMASIAAASNLREMGYLSADVAERYSVKDWVQKVGKIARSFERTQGGTGMAAHPGQSSPIDS